MTDEEIMTRHAEGDRHSFGEIFARWAPRLHGYFLRVTGASADADDLLQATFLKVHRGRMSFRPEMGLRGWLFTIAARVRRDEARRRFRRPSDADLATAEELAAPEAGDFVVARERASAVRAALARLPDSQREVIYLHRFEQMSFAEIASVLDTSEGAVKLRAFRGYEKLREEILDFGCPHGSLCQELEKLGARSALAKAGARLLGVNLRFAERQLRALGHGNRASPLARDLVASLQGTLLLAHTMRSRAVLKERLSRIELWVDALPTQARRAS